ncbi:hypothetical protein GDO78_009082 [Eleutherodactylus coqui]|uniref:Uncharacterized protein n=1 Tax=Eleutherodactylus coqui TaxID=57060 RepID=A0A8J6F9E7_ELECQ|nr:hypothetical protein GDO78_009082 [Eleutherodactylus coqui]
MTRGAHCLDTSCASRRLHTTDGRHSSTSLYDVAPLDRGCFSVATVENFLRLLYGSQMIL